MRRYRLVVIGIDLLAAAGAGQAAYAVRFRASDWHAYPSQLVALAMPFAWVALVAANRGYETRYLGAGQIEFARVVKSFINLTLIIAFSAYALHEELARGFVLVALPLALVLDLLGRYSARKWLHRLRCRGQGVRSVLAVGDSCAVVEFAEELRRDCYAGMRVRGACVTGTVGDDGDRLAAAGVPLIGGVDSVRQSATSIGADTVAVVSSTQMGSERLRWIAWQLEGTEIDLVVSPGLTEIAGRRIHICPVAGLPLLHVAQPEFRGARRLLKEAMDRVGALVAIVMLAPVFVALYVAVRVTSRGPAMFRQERAGRDGQRFKIMKFRSMYLDAEARLPELRRLNVYGDGPLFKIRDDPRVTPIGRTLRRYSLDELPQLFNVLTGRMSLVGPRPPLPSEVEKYEDAARRRLLVKPGLTGLWQVSGRSDLSWEECVRLDLRYVENWSPFLDLFILWKTAFAVIRGSGAY